MNLKALLEKRAELATQMRTMHAKAEEEDRGFSSEERESWDKMSTDIDDLDSRIEAGKRAMSFGDIAVGLETGDLPAQRGTGEPKGEESDKKAENRAFENWVRYGMGGLTQEERMIVANQRQDLTAEQRAQSAGTGSEGGFMVPEGFQNELESAMLEFGGMREAARILNTAQGNDLPWPTTNDTAQKGEIIGENTQHNEQDIVFGSVTLGAYTYSSKIVRVSLQLLQDSAINVSALVASMLAERIARITNEHLTTGTGTAQPNGAVTASTQGKQGTTGQTTSIIYDDLVDLEHSVDPSYRRNGRFMFHDQTLKGIKKLKDSEGRPLWLPGIATREPDTILAYPYTINQDMPQMAANAKSVLFGDFNKYIVRDVLGVTLLQLRERYADFLQVGFLSFSRHDGELIDAGTNPLKHYANSAT